MKEILANRRLIWKLAKNDFKKRYAGSSLGAVWAMIQPVITVLMYWFVFQGIMNQKYQSIAEGVNVPYVLFLTAGLVPWFFFSEALNINILPVVRVTAALFIHAFFALVLIIVSLLYGYRPSLYMLQIVYYSFGLFVFSLGLSYITSAIVVFFRDLTQIISIGLQLGMWATPVLWDISMANNWSPVIAFIIQLNPVCYVVTGYRNAIYGQQWFWERPGYTLYFWAVSLGLLWLGRKLFDKLKFHFADVL